MHHRPTRADLLAALVIAGAIGCDDPAPPTHDRDSALRVSSSSIVLVDDETALLVASPDDDRLVRIDASTLDVTAAWPLPITEPARVAFDDGIAVVTARLDTAVARVDLHTGRVDALPIPCGGSRGVVIDPSHGARAALIACPHDDRIVVLPLDSDDPPTWTAVVGRPTELALTDNVVHVSLAGVGQLASFDRASLREGRATGTHVVSAPDPGPDRRVSTLEFLALDDAGAPAATWLRVDNDGDRDRPPELGGYGNVVDAVPRIEPRIHAPGCAASHARFDGRERVMSGAGPLARGDGGWWVVHPWTGTVARIRCDEASALLPVDATWRVGAGAHGIAVSADGRTAWVDVAWDHAVARLAWDERRGYDLPPDVAPRRRPVETRRLSREATRGRRLFHDARSIQLTPSGVVTCATCHPGGGEDGLRWFLHTPGVTRRVRRTPPTWGLDTRAAGLHWDAEFTDPDVLVRATIRELMEGLGLGVDARDLTRYMAETPPPPGRPAIDAADAARIERGERVYRFEAACAGCHGDDGDTPTGRHAVLPSSSDPDAMHAPVRTPSLRGIRARAPYGHDGRAASLRELLTVHNPDDVHGRTSHLDDDALEALLRYLETR